jgi:glycosyltransferase involved in cell wall biosynthesis
MSIALVTMTRNGLTKLPRLFESVRGFADKALVLDTGSTDGTQNWLWEQSILPVEMITAPFVNFETSRNHLNELAQGKADWLLLLDDDMALTFPDLPGTGVVKASLDLNVPAYMLEHAGNLGYWITRLVRGDRFWRYKGVTHEYLVGGGATNPKLKGVEVEHYYNHGSEKFTRDLQLLTADIARDPNDERTIFYVANTLRDIGQTRAAIRFYKMRVWMGGWDEEVYVSMYEAARLAEDPTMMTQAYNFRPSRAEPAAWLSRYWDKNGDADMAHSWERVRVKIPMPSDVLFVIKAAYGPTQK